MSDERIKVASFGIKNGSYRQIAMQDFVALFALQISLKDCILIWNFPIKDDIFSGSPSDLTQIVQNSTGCQNPTFSCTKNEIERGKIARVVFFLYNNLYSSHPGKNLSQACSRRILPH